MAVFTLPFVTQMLVCFEFRKLKGAQQADFVSLMVDKEVYWMNR